MDSPSLIGVHARVQTPQGAAFRVAPRLVVVTKRGTTPTPVLVDGFEAGYVWDSRSTASTSNPGTRRPLKDGFYDHAQNTVEYIVLAFGPAAGARPKRPDPDPFHLPLLRPAGVDGLSPRLPVAAD